MSRAKHGGTNIDAPHLNEFLESFQSGDREAVERLLPRLDPLLRSIIRLRLVDGRLRRIADTGDILQSLLKDFLARKDAEPVSAQRATGLYAYLAAAAHNKIQTRSRKQYRHGGNLTEFPEPTCSERPAVRQVEDRDLVGAVRLRLREETREIFDLAAQGLPWNEIAERCGGKPDALRMRLRREVAAVSNALAHENATNA
jgi:DNA-directed RNA polymerase specialized sigma24 family protein